MTKNPDWMREFEQIRDWSAWLAKGDDADKIKRLRSHLEKGLPCGSEKFIAKLEKISDHVLCYRPTGRPRKKDHESAE